MIPWGQLHKEDQGIWEKWALDAFVERLMQQIKLRDERIAELEEELAENEKNRRDFNVFLS